MAESSSAQALTAEPSGTLTVMSWVGSLKKDWIDACERIEVLLGCWVSLGEVRSSDVSAWSIVWCARWHFLHLCWDWHWCTNIQVVNSSYKIHAPSVVHETFQSWGRPLNLVQAYRGVCQPCRWYRCHQCELCVLELSCHVDHSCAASCLG